MTDCNRQTLTFSSLGPKAVVADFLGGRLTSDAGALLLREAGEATGLFRALDRAIPDPRDPALIIHDQRTLIAQRIIALALGYEDLNDHQALRTDPALQLAAGAIPDQDAPLASPATLCRLENRIDRPTLVRFAAALVDQFIAAHPEPPEHLILDFDATDDPVHGHQEGRFFHGYYDQYCFLPLYVFCGDELVTAYLRPSKIDAAKHARALLKLLVRRFRRTGQPQRIFDSFAYAAGTWDRPRRVIVKAEHNAQGPNPRFLVVNVPGDPRQLYEEVYCQRGEMENRIKEQQLDLFADRTSCHRFLANQFRLLLSSAAYVLIQALRRTALCGTELARAQVGTIRLRLLKVAARVVVSARRVVFHLASSYPYQEVFRAIFLRVMNPAMPGRVGIG